jgi:trimethylamine--corrinoid protein Co-methyltransferase
MTDLATEPQRPQRRKSSRRDKISRKAKSGSVSSRKTQALRLTPVNKADAGMIHDAVLKILWEIGVIVDHHPSRKMLVEEFGCREGSDGYIRMPPDLVEQAISTVPKKITLYDLNGDLRVDTSTKIPSYCPGHNCVRIVDHRTRELRPCRLEDIKNTAVLCEKLPNIDMVCSLGYPSDIAAEDEAVETVRAMVENSIKPAAILAHDDVIQGRILGFLAEVAGGWNNLADKPTALELMGPISPLKLPDDFCLRLINCARRRIPVVCYPATFPGMSCPISVAGAIAQSSAEAIAGIVLHQSTEPGAPVMSGSAVLPMDMRQADLAYGSPEYMLNCLGASDYFQFLGIPSWIGAGCSDSHDFDAQAAAEAGANMAIAALAGTSFVHNLGFLSGGRTGSLEMLVLCDELVGWSNQMAAGVTVDADSVAFEVIQRAAPENAFLTDQHTQDRYLTENWYPSLFGRSDADAWIENGGRDLRARIAQKLSDILDA